MCASQNVASNRSRTVNNGVAAVILLLLGQGTSVRGAFTTNVKLKSTVTRCEESSTRTRCNDANGSFSHKSPRRYPLLRSSSAPEDTLSYDSEDCATLENCNVPLETSRLDLEDNDNDGVRLEQQRGALQEEFEAWAGAVRKAIKALTKKQKSLQSEWTKAQGVESTTARAQLLVNNLYFFANPGVTSATVQDWENDGKEVELTLDPQYNSASAEADALFAQVRKLKRGSQVVSKLLEETSDALELLEEMNTDLQASAATDDENRIHEGRFRLIQDRLERTRSTTSFQIPSPKESTQENNSAGTNKKNGGASAESNIRKLTSRGGCPVWVGRNRRGNEYLTFHVAKGRDVWMHARGCPGAHVLLMHRRGGMEPTESCLEFAANLAVFYSDARNEQRAVVSMAEPKHLLKPRGAPLGAVKLRQELKSIMGRPANVPNELKLARDESGLSDEYHLNDKAKHRRRTLEVAKLSQAKRRAQQKQKQRAKRRNRVKSSNDDT